MSDQLRHKAVAVVAALYDEQHGFLLWNNKPGNPLEESLQTYQSARSGAGRTFGSRGYWGWFTAEELRQGNEMSPDIAALSSPVIETAEKC